MKPLVTFFDSVLVPWLSLTKLDAFWSDTLHGSFVYRSWQLAKAGADKLFGALQKPGAWLHWLAYPAVVALFFIIPAPQFANDKEGLALIVAGALSLRIIGALAGGRETFKPSAVDMLVLAFFGINIVSTAASHYLVPAAKGLAKLAVYIGSYFLFVSVLQTDTKQRSITVLSSMLAAGALVSLYGIYQYKIGVAPLATWEDPSVGDKTTRVYATLRNPNLLAGYLVPLIPLGLSATIMSAIYLKGWRRCFALVPFGIAGATILSCIFTGSRGGYIGIAAGITALVAIAVSTLWVSYSKLRVWIIFALVAAPLIILAVLHQFPAYEHRVLSIFAWREHSSNAYRLYVYNASWQMFLDNWWLGVGPGNQAFVRAYGLYMRSGFDALGTYSVPLEVAVECGIVGLTIFLALIASLLARAHQGFWQLSGKMERWILAGAASAILAMMMHGLVDTVFYRPQVQFIFWLLSALIVAVAFLKDKPHEPERGKPEMNSIPSDQTTA